MPQTLALTKNRSLYQGIVLNILSKMDLGTMHITMPNGENLVLGNGEGNVVAYASIHSNEFFKRVILYGDVGFGEAYVDGLWDTDNITDVIKWFLLNVENNPAV